MRFNNNYWRFWSGRLRGQFPTIAPFIEQAFHSQPYKFVPHSHRSPGCREGRVNEWRRELSPKPADRRRRDQRPRPLGHPAPRDDALCWLCLLACSGCCVVSK